MNIYQLLVFNHLLTILSNLLLDLMLNLSKKIELLVSNLFLVLVLVELLVTFSRNTVNRIVILIFYENSLLSPIKAAVYLPNPTWPNHKNIFHDSGLQIKEYKYYEPKTKGLNFNGLIDDLKGANEQSIILFHACAHNPTGIILTSFTENSPFYHRC